ncbi:ComF family protein [Leptospira koniambonensis]|uniref:ComF family protein n=1 Tax=Leptospira koniambonensis TaxID=2484950 RepID=A0A4R9JAR3_9LEPT|nr:ComF family protein [Leptospira koniambonensis]TGL35042.1 ComF family protein [Leptospira koniambonensis]
MRFLYFLRLLDFFFPLLCGICGREDFFSLKIGLCKRCNYAARTSKQLYRCNVCSSPLPDAEKVCEFCDSRNVFFTKVFSLRDRTDLLGELLNKLKSNNEYPVSIFLSLGIRKALRELKTLDLDACILLPSYSKNKIFNPDLRPFSPSGRLYEETRRILKIPLIDPLIKTSPERQAGKNFSERFFHAYSAWGIKSNWKDRCPSKILLLDDVFTTGASVNEACRILKKNGTKSVYVLTYLRVSD